MLLSQRVSLVNWSQTPSNVIGGDSTYTAMRHVRAVNTALSVQTANGALSKAIKE